MLNRITERLFCQTRVMRSLHSVVVAWRKYAALPILLLQIVTGAWCSSIVYGCVVALWLTVPCGIKMVNCRWYLWYPRQLLFATMSALALWDGMQ